MHDDQDQQNYDAHYRKTDTGETERRCPRCGAWAQADHIDNGIGMQQCGPYCCDACQWIDPITPAGWEGFHTNE